MISSLITYYLFRFKTSLVFAAYFYLNVSFSYHFFDCLTLEKLTRVENVKCKCFIISSGFNGIASKNL